ncbi:MAG TPA: SH3-like domain-containing protein [Acidimicrobiia bacterium]
MSGQRFVVGGRVRVRSHVEGGNPRTPDYAKGRAGTVTALHGVIDNPFDHHHPYPPLYTIVFHVADLSGRNTPDLVTADLHEEWLEQA